MSKSLTGYGPEYEMIVTKEEMRELMNAAGGQNDPLPRMGYEIDMYRIHLHRETGAKVDPLSEFAVLHTLLLMNLSGTYVIASTTDQVRRWPGLFPVTKSLCKRKL